MNEFMHDSVMLESAVNWLVSDASGVYIDGTFGRGGHSRSILSRLDAEGQLIGFDKDPAAVTVGRALMVEDTRFHMVWDSFIALQKGLDEIGASGCHGILLDLGVSSPQLDDAERGFSFMHDGPLDMRMNPEAGVSAADWVNFTDETEIARVLWEYGEEKFSRRMAKAIVLRRAERPFTRTGDLAEVIKAANPRWEKHKHPATRAFQAIRIHINNELGDLEKVLDAALQVLVPGGRLVVISFHSLEDRIVKRFMRDKSQGPKIPRGMPVLEKDIKRHLKVLVKGDKADQGEVRDNVRARSAVLRVAERLEGAV